MTLRILIDASASMSGFQTTGVLSGLHTWITHAASQLESLAVHVVRRPTAAFSRRVGVRDLPGSAPSPSDFGSDTNLADAVLDAGLHDMTVVVTDGVPYAGQGGGSGDCAAGADFGCVIGRLGEYLERHPESGYWVLPLAGPFQGDVYLEGQSVPAGLSPTDVADEVRGQFPGWSVRVSLGGTGERAKIPYSGPKFILAWVLAKDSSVGRSFVASLLDQAPLRQIELLDANASQKTPPRQGVVSLLTPIEVLPGFEPSHTVVAAQPLEREAFGPVELRWNATQAANPLLEVHCSDKDPGWSVASLLLSSPALVSSPCKHNLVSLPLVGRRFDVDPQWAGDQAQVRQLVGVSAIHPHASGDGEDVELVLTCGQSTGPACAEADSAQAGASLTFSATLHYGEAARQLADTGPITSIVAAIHTDSIARQPHRALGFQSLIRGVLERAAGSARAMPLATLRVCRTSG